MVVAVIWRNGIGLFAFSGSGLGIDSFEQSNDTILLVAKEIHTRRRGFVEMGDC